ncbi:MAG: hypothetical protein WAN46_20430 [Gammaproteobacteria bacterium]|jgi:hypothetical protein
MNGKEYETLIHDLVSRLVGHQPAILLKMVKSGRENKINGASRFAHQVDVSVKNAPFLNLIECKYWSRRVGPQAVLVLAARLVDIRDANPSLDVCAHLVSTKAVTNGARVLAEHFGISLDVVSSIEEYGIRLRDQVFVGVRDPVVATDSFEAENIPGKVG